jgi:hypothetical protein
MRNAACLLIALISSALRIGLISDAHIDIYYQPNVPYLSSVIACHDLIHNGTTTKDIANYGRKKCDSPIELFNSALTHLKTAQPDVLLYAGDMVSHLPKSWEETKQIMKLGVNAVINTFSNIPVLFTFGNDDVVDDYQVPNTAFKTEYYTAIYDYWIGSVPSIAKYVTSSTKTTFLNGGYYSLDIDGVKYISLNSLYYTLSNSINNDPQAADEQLKWLEQSLIDTRNAGIKALLLYHVPTGVFVSTSGNVKFWNETYFARFNSMMQLYSNEIIIGITGHTHIEDLRVNNVGVCATQGMRGMLYNNNIVLRGVSPNRENNPGYSVLDMDGYEPALLTSFTFELEQSVNSTDPMRFWKKLYDSNKDLGMKNLTALGVSDFQARVAKNLVLFLKYVAYKLG